MLVVGHFARDDLRGDACAREQAREVLEQQLVVWTPVEVQDLDRQLGWLLSPLDARSASTALTPSLLSTILT
jgi:hypothetical protein